MFYNVYSLYNNTERLESSGPNNRLFVLKFRIKLI